MDYKQVIEILVKREQHLFKYIDLRSEFENLYRAGSNDYRKKFREQIIDERKRKLEKLDELES